MLDTRREVRRLWGKLQFSPSRAMAKFSCALVVAWILAMLPAYPGLEDAAREAFFILLFAIGLWVTEAVPSFAVAFLVIALEIYILGRPDGPFAATGKSWEIFVRPWSSPLIWLFFSGFVMAQAAHKTRLDRWFARHVLGWFGSNPRHVLLGLMAITFTFSMFMSNTATTAMMMAVLAPIVASMGDENPFRRGILLGVPFAANIGGMGTIIGSPPNAIAVGSLTQSSISFLDWMIVGLPPAILLAGIAYLYLIWSYPSSVPSIDLSSLKDPSYQSAQLPNWKKLLVMIVFFLTVILWMTGPLHHIPTPVISFIPIAIFSVARVTCAEDIRQLSWDVLILLTGGLSLGVAVAETGLAVWLVDVLPLGDMGIFLLALTFSYLATILSNFMSNTAAANILVPIGIAAASGLELMLVVPIALGASAAMCLPISTPPNAIAYTSGLLRNTDFMRAGVLIGLLAPLLAVIWCFIIW